MSEGGLEDSVIRGFVDVVVSGDEAVRGVLMMVVLAAALLVGLVASAIKDVWFSALSVVMAGEVLALGQDSMHWTSKGPPLKQKDSPGWLSLL